MFSKIKNNKSEYLEGNEIGEFANEIFKSFLFDLKQSIKGIFTKRNELKEFDKNEKKENKAYYYDQLDAFKSNTLRLIHLIDWVI